MNFEHGMLVVASREGSPAGHYSVHEPRWWMLWTWVAWLIAWVRGRTGAITLSTGESLRIVARGRRAP